MRAAGDPSPPRAMTSARNGCEVAASWKGEYLTHIRLVPKILSALCGALRIDARRMPLVNAFEQAFVMVARPVG